jgi:hypothetical protein
VAQIDNSQGVYDNLKTLINENSRYTEEECRVYLQYAKNLLFRDPSRVLSYYVEPEQIEEYRLHGGDSDYIVVAKIKDELDRQSVRAYLWELKAPQCPMFVTETNSRLRPSEYLYKAINQLLHFYRECKQSGSFRDVFNIVNQEDVKMGGIIIGRNDNRVPNSLNATNKKILFNQVTYAWDYLFNDKIRLFTWEKILDWIKPKETYINEQYTPMS